MLPGCLLGSVGILLIVLGATGVEDANSTEYVSTTCSLIDATWQERCNKKNQEETCSYTCAYVLESDVTGSERFGSSDMTSADITGTGSNTGCNDFSCVVNVDEFRRSQQSLGDIKKCGGGPCARCSASEECSGCI